MRLKRLWVKDFKNLQDVTVEFDPSHFITVLVGWNGTGKSNLIEALVIIFRDLDLGVGPEFTYKLEYICRDRYITIVADLGKGAAGRMQINYQEKLDSDLNEFSGEVPWGPKKQISFSVFKKDEGKKYLPKNVFGYYSGPSNRLEKHFEVHQKKFYNQLLYPEKYGIDGQTLPLRPLFYARQVHSQFVLLSFFLDDSPVVKKFLKEQLGILEMDSVLFVMRSPKQWSWKNRKGGDKRFWHASGIVQQFLDRLYNISLAPHRVTKSRTEEYLYLFVKDQEALKKLAQDMIDADFFKELESTYLSDLIEEVRIRVKVREINDSMTFKELSEGEQQLLTVLGLLRFTAEKESLFLLDEPDTHLNPAWGMNYIEFLSEIAGFKDNDDNELNCEVVLSTHDPIVLASLRKDQVEIMKRDTESMNVYVEAPAYDPVGMGYTGILTSDMFGLRSDLDLLTLSKLDRKVELASKEILEPEELIELENINNDLEKAGFLESYSDPYFSQFIKAWGRAERAKKYLKPFLSDADRNEMATFADEIVQEIKKEKEE